MVTKISADSDAVELLGDIGYDLSEKGVKALLTDLAKSQTEATPGGTEGGVEGGEGDQTSKLEDRLDQLEGQQLFNEAFNSFMSDEKMAKAYDTADSQNKLMKYMTENNILDFSEAHKILTADQTATESAQRIKDLEEENAKLQANRSPNAPVTGQGAQATVEPSKSGVVHGDFGFSSARKILTGMLKKE